MERSKYKHIIWDWNGTLLDDAWLCVDVINGVLSRRNMSTISLRQYQELFNFPVIDYYVRWALILRKSLSRSWEQNSSITTKSAVMK